MLTVQGLTDPACLSRAMNLSLPWDCCAHQLNSFSTWNSSDTTPGPPLCDRNCLELAHSHATALTSDTCHRPRATRISISGCRDPSRVPHFAKTAHGTQANAGHLFIGLL